MKKILFLSIIAVLTFSSCDDFLQRDPLDFGSEKSYFKTVADLQKAANDFYPMLPGNSSLNYSGLYTIDNNSDNQCNFSSNSNFYEGIKMTPTVAESEWKFSYIRDCNYYIKLIPERMADKQIVGNEDQINHYLGEFYFFRAFDYFRLLTKIGDAPIIKDVISDEHASLVKNSKRAPRNEVARFILEDLKKAESLMLNKAPQVGRLYKDCATFMIARVALFEATWEKYHAGTAFVPGNAKWVGHKMYPDFQFESGSAQNEINFFLDEAIAASQKIASTRPLFNNYISLFNSNGINAIPEIVMAKSYLKGTNGHSVPKLLQAGGYGMGFTRSLVESFLMDDGLPIYASPKYDMASSDTSLVTLTANMDVRLKESIKLPDEVNVVKPDGTVSLFGYPNIENRMSEGCPTGYEMRKWHVTDQEQGREYYQGISDTPIFRAAEAYLIYLEAYYERHGELDANCDTYWKALRARAGVSTDYMSTINATDLSKEGDLGKYSHRKLIDKTLYNIRRERRCEFIAEGMRLDDLRRWRSLDNMNSTWNNGQGYIIEGMNLWDHYYTHYPYVKNGVSYYDMETIRREVLKGDIVSQPDDSKYIRPHRVYQTDRAFDGYNFPKPHYLEPIPVNEIIMTSENSDSSTSSIYQNPGWPNFIAGPADYSYDCD